MPLWKPIVVRILFACFVALATSCCSIVKGDDPISRYPINRLGIRSLAKNVTIDNKELRSNQDSGDIQQHGMPIDADWNKAAWRDVPTLELTHFMGDRPEHFPHTQAKLLYDDDAIYVIFRVADRYVRAVAKEHQDHVYLDSCVEFFFSPSDDATTAYMNLEMNCGGTMLLHFQTIPRERPIEWTSQEVAQIKVAHSMPKNVDPEVTEATTWTVEYRLPIKLLRKYYDNLASPGPGVIWRGNFYKCADHTSHPHWLTWAPIDNPVPDFHIPRFFGVLEFQ